jgi:DnaJ-class molecular chaperone
MDGSTTVECETCGGSGELFEDVADCRGEHDTIAVTCTECGGTGVADFDDDDVEPSADLNAEASWEAPL